MGAALVAGLLAGGHDRSDLLLVEDDAERRAELQQMFAGVAVHGEPGGASGTVVAVKPSDGEPACRKSASAGTRRLLSVMAGVTLTTLESWVGPDVAVVRSIPNTPSLIGAGVSAVSPGSRAGEDDLRWAEELLAKVGVVVRLPEASLDAVTGLSGSGPAYVFLVAEALIDAGVLAGLPRAVSRLLALHTLAGTGRLLVESGDGPEALRAQVTSPGGTTAAGLRVLESRAVRAAFLDAVMAATERSRAMGEEP